MNRRFFTVVLILLLLASWVVIIDLARHNKALLNALKIAEDFLGESREEIDEMSNTVERLMRDSRAVDEWNDKMPDFR